MTKEILQKLDYIKSDKFKLREHIYMAMALVGEQKVCIAVAYKIDYCIKKAEQFATSVPQIKFAYINKVKVGELKACKRFEIN